MTSFKMTGNLNNSDVLIDHLSLLLAGPLLEEIPSTDSYLVPAATFLESLVLYESILIDSFTNTPKFKFIHRFSDDMEDEPETLVSLLFKSLNFFGPPAYGIHPNNHEELVEETLNKLPSGLVNYLDTIPETKVKILESIDIIFPNFEDFSWEWYLKPFSEELARMGNSEALQVISIIYDLVDEMPEHLKPKISKDGKSIQLSDKLFFFRTTGPIAKQAYYLALAAYNGIPYIPPYQRNVFFKAFIAAQNDIDFAKKLINSGAFASTVDEMATTQSSIIRYFEQQVIQSLDDILSSVLPWTSTTVKLPSVFSKIVSTAKERKITLLDAAIEMRNSANAKGFRKWCEEITNAISNNDRKHLVKAIREIVRECELWSKKLGIDNKNSQISFNMPLISYKRGIPDPITTVKSRLSKPILFLRDLM